MSLRQQSIPLPQQGQPLWTKSFIVLTCSYFFLFMNLQLLLAPLPAYVKDRFVPGDFTLSLVTGLFALTAIAARFATSALMQRLKHSVLLYTGIGLCVLATALYPFADSVNMLLLLRILFGIGFGMSSTVIPTFVSQVIPQERIGEGIGYFGLSTSLAMSIGPMAGLSIMDSYGFSLLTICATAVAAAIVPLLALTRTLPPLPALEHSAGRGEEDGSQAAVPAFSKDSLIVPVVLNVLLSASYGGILAFLALYGREIGLDNIGLFFLFNALTVLAVRPISGRLYDSKGHAVVLIPAAILLIISLTLLSVLSTLALLVISALLFGLGFGAIQSTLQAWLVGGVPRHKHGMANSLFFNSIDLGVAGGSMVLATLAANTSYAIMYRYSAGIIGLFLLLYLLTQFKRQAKSGSSK